MQKSALVFPTPPTASRPFSLSNTAGGQKNMRELK
jgi:hypothetical protein